jgi:hypothetical protein
MSRGEKFSRGFAAYSNDWNFDIDVAKAAL